MATKANIEMFDARRAELEAKLAANKAAAEERLPNPSELAADCHRLQVWRRRQAVRFHRYP